MTSEFRDSVTRWGLGRGLYSTIMQRLKWWLGMTVTGIYRAPLKKPGKSPPESVRASLASAADLAPFVGKRGYELSPEFVASAFARDDLCVATYVDGAFAAYGWVAYRTAPHVDGVWVQFAAGQRYNYKNLTLPEYRGRHIRGSFGVLQTRDQYECVTHSLAFIETHNYASIRAE
ncbi:MAG: hypothetical protein ACR2PZ_07900, partial [Pseudomonadales bacterium]